MQNVITGSDGDSLTIVLGAAARVFDSELLEADGIELEESPAAKGIK